MMASRCACYYLIKRYKTKYIFELNINIFFRSPPSTSQTGGGGHILVTLLYLNLQEGKGGSLHLHSWGGCLIVKILKEHLFRKTKYKI